MQLYITTHVSSATELREYLKRKDIDTNIFFSKFHASFFIQVGILLLSFAKQQKACQAKRQASE